MKFSIVITTHNRLSWLKRAIDSALAQTETCEVIVVDDGSSDGTDDYLRNLNGKVTFWRNSENLGHSAVMNVGVNLARGDWIKPLDDDDYLAPNCIETMMRAIERHPPTVICSCQAIQVDVNGTPIGRPRQIGARKVFYIPQADIHYGMLLEQVPFGTTSQVAFSRNVFLQSGGWDVSLDVCDEIDSWIRIAQFGDAIFVNSCLVYRTSWPGSYNRQSPLQKRLAANISMKEKIYALVDDRHRAAMPPLETIRNYLKLHWLFVALKQKQLALACSLAFPAGFFPAAWMLLADAVLWRRQGQFKTSRVRQIPLMATHASARNESDSERDLTVAIGTQPMIDFSVVICTYNGAAKLPTLLERLRSQRQIDNLNWEILIVDNNSNDGTAKLIAEYQRGWDRSYPLRYCFEARQGLAFARRLAVREAQGELLGFLDDDNWPADDWVATAYSFGQCHPQAGAYGSRIQGDYEGELPANFDQIACFLGIIERSSQPFRYDLLARWLFPAGAGLVVRKQAWWSSVPDTFILTGVAGTSLGAKGEDIETLSYLRRQKWQIWHNPQMLIFHHIPQYRLQKAYLLRLFRGVGLSRYPLRMLQSPTWQKPFRLLLYFISDFSKLILHCTKYGGNLDADLVVQCQRHLLLYTLASPFYYGWQWLSLSIGLQFSEKLSSIQPVSRSRS